jgi:hypothetical protein
MTVRAYTADEAYGLAADEELTGTYNLSTLESYSFNEMVVMIHVGHPSNFRM